MKIRFTRRVKAWFANFSPNSLHSSELQEFFQEFYTDSGTSKIAGIARACSIFRIVVSL
jgi:hypothetical protein